MKLQVKRGYVESRVRTYPSVQDQLDAIWKILKELIDTHGVEMPEDAVAVLWQIQQIKQTYPKE